MPSHYSVYYDFGLDRDVRFDKLQIRLTKHGEDGSNSSHSEEDDEKDSTSPPQSPALTRTPSIPRSPSARRGRGSFSRASTTTSPRVVSPGLTYISDVPPHSSQPKRTRPRRGSQVLSPPPGLDVEPQKQFQHQSSQFQQSSSARSSQPHSPSTTVLHSSASHSGFTSMASSPGGSIHYRPSFSLPQLLPQQSRKSISESFNSSPQLEYAQRKKKVIYEIETCLLRFENLVKNFSENICHFVCEEIWKYLTCELFLFHHNNLGEIFIFNVENGNFMGQCKFLNSKKHKQSDDTKYDDHDDNDIDDNDDNDYNENDIIEERYESTSPSFFREKEVTENYFAKNSQNETLECGVNSTFDYTILPVGYLKYHLMVSWYTKIVVFSEPGKAVWETYTSRSCGTLCNSYDNMDTQNKEDVDVYLFSKDFYIHLEPYEHKISSQKRMPLKLIKLVEPQYVVPKEYYSGEKFGDEPDEPAPDQVFNVLSSKHLPANDKMRTPKYEPTGNVISSRLTSGSYSAPYAAQHLVLLDAVTGEIIRTDKLPHKLTTYCFDNSGKYLYAICRSNKCRYIYRCQYPLCRLNSLKFNLPKHYDIRGVTCDSIGYVHVLCGSDLSDEHQIYSFYYNQQIDQLQQVQQNKKFINWDRAWQDQPTGSRFSWANYEMVENFLIPPNQC